jgi:cytochrome c peroxidase
MNRKISITVFFITACSLFIYTSCKKSTVVSGDYTAVPELPAIPFDYMTVNTPDGDFDLKSMFVANQFFRQDPMLIDPNFSAKFKGNESMSNATVALGRVLFYDKRLSINNTVACASCHKQNMAFSDGKSVSFGFGDKKTGRNSMAIITPLAMNSLFWDSRAESAFDLSLRPVFNHIEMGMETDEMLVNKISNTDFYKALFTKAYGSPVVNKTNLASAISDFLNSMVTMNSKFDQGVSQNFNNYTAMEKLGKDLFFSKQLNCISCHAGNTFSAPDGDPGSAYSLPSVKGTANIGLDLNYTDNGKGNGKFRIPSLRNIELTAPYMHDGRFSTLEDVVEHYNSGIKSHPDLDGNLKDKGLPKRMNLTPIEKSAVVAFLKTLTDKKFISDKRYSNPFKS